MTGGISVLAESPKRSNQTSPINSQDSDGDEDDEDTDMEVEQIKITKDDVKNNNVVCSNVVFSVIDWNPLRLVFVLCVHLYIFVCLYILSQVWYFVCKFLDFCNAIL